jgi:hypothetical protein
MSRTAIAARIMGAVVGLFLTFDSVGKVIPLPPMVDGTVRLGYPATAVRALGIIELACLALYLFPRTAVLGAVLLTGYLGGAIATHVRMGSPLLSHTLFPIYVAVLVWGAVYLTEDRVRALIPIRR